MGARHTFFCIDGHTCGNPVRVVAGGGPTLAGGTMSERRQHFLRDYDWIRRALMFEPRGHDLMSGSVLYPPISQDADLAILFVETSGCLPMCGHGTIGTVTIALEHGLVAPRDEGSLVLDTPAGRVDARYRRNGTHVEGVRITNVPSFLAETGVAVECPGLGTLTVDIAYGGNFYAIVDPQLGYAGMEAFSAAELLAMSPGLRAACNRVVECIHPDDPSIAGVSHVMWTGAPRDASAHARNAVFYGSGALDRSPCGTGSSARMAQWAALGKLAPGDEFVHESIIGSLFRCRVESATRVGNHDAIVPSVEGWARVTGLNTIFVDEDDPFAHGFQVT